MYTMGPQFSEEHSISSLDIKLNGDKERGLQLEAFDPLSFRKNAEIVIAKLEQYISDASIRGLALTDPKVMMNAAKRLMTKESMDIPLLDEEKLKAIIDLFVKTGIPVYSPGYMGRQFSGVIPLSGIIDFVCSMVSQPSSFYEAAQLPNVVERIMAEEFNQFIGWDPDQFSMVTTSGGSLANMTALLAARNERYPQFSSDGMAAFQGAALPAIAVSDDAHYSISRAASIMGIGARQIVRLPINKKRQIDLEQVRPTLKKAAEQGLDIFCMVASTGSTSIGAIDPIDQLADIAAEEKIWFHVDGAHGASLMVSDQLRPRLKGLNKVDSFAWDAHKMMFMPAVCSLLFYKNKNKAYSAFQKQQASYVFEKEMDIYTQFDSAEKNFECTKRPMIMPLWVCWALYGKELFATKLEYLCGLAKQAFHMLEAEEDFVTIHQPEANILCFRYLPSKLPKDLSDFQLLIRNRIKESQRFFISKIDLDGSSALRVVFMNHRIEMGHFRMLLKEIRKTGQALLKETNSVHEQKKLIINANKI